MIPRPPRSTLFPTRRSSDLKFNQMFGRIYTFLQGRHGTDVDRFMDKSLDELSRQYGTLFGGDRKSTRLNSSHVEISYAVFCLKKKKNQHYSRATGEGRH